MITEGSEVYFIGDPLAHAMEVLEVDGTKVLCTWRNSAGKRDWRKYPIAILTLVNPHPPFQALLRNTTQPRFA
jgi:hypothetical protein